MLLRRVIPCLDVREGRVVKGTRFVDLVDQGDPAALGAQYAQAGADELCLLDITATVSARTTLLAVVERNARQLFIPLTVGGGVRSVSDMRRVLRAGADRVAVNSAAVADPALLDRCARRFGRQCVVASIDARRIASPDAGVPPGRTTQQEQAPSPARWEVVIHGGRRATGRDVVAWAREAVERGAGEILLTSIDQDGTRAGYDLELLRAVTSAVNVPVVASGGAGSPADLVAAVREGHADAVLAASIFHRDPQTIGTVKAAMAAAGIPVRLAGAP